MGYIGMCSPKGYGFSAILAIKRVLIVAILVLNRSLLFPSSLIHVCVFKNKPLFHHCRKDHKKSLSLIMFRVGLIWGTN